MKSRRRECELHEPTFAHLRSGEFSGSTQFARTEPTISRVISVEPPPAPTQVASGVDDSRLTFDDFRNRLAKDPRHLDPNQLAERWGQVRGRHVSIVFAGDDVVAVEEERYVDVVLVQRAVNGPEVIVRFHNDVNVAAEAGVESVHDSRKHRVRRVGARENLPTRVRGEDAGLGLGSFGDLVLEYRPCRFFERQLPASPNRSQRPSSSTPICRDRATWRRGPSERPRRNGVVSRMPASPPSAFTLSAGIAAP